ncbi:MAG: hypothetical protein U1D00_04945 [Mycobacterium sp.]|nr:hypothetical protein [Mycobacterium sp.]
MDSGAGPRPDCTPDRDPAPGTALTPELLADLQAGLLDDTTAARVRRQARADPEATRVLADLDAVRRDLAHLGSDPRTAPAVPAAVTARVGAALRAAPPPGPSSGGHALPRPSLTRRQRAGLTLGIGAVAAAVVLGAVMVTRDDGSALPSGPTADQITVEQTVDDTDFPVSDTELQAALSEVADLGPLADAQRRAACLAGPGHSPAPEVLGGRQLEVSGRPAVLLLIPGEPPGQVLALAVEPDCSAADTGLIAERVLPRQ